MDEQTKAEHKNNLMGYIYDIKIDAHLKNKENIFEHNEKINEFVKARVKTEGGCIRLMEGLERVIRIDTTEKDKEKIRDYIYGILSNNQTELSIPNKPELNKILDAIKNNNEDQAKKALMEYINYIQINAPLKKIATEPPNIKATNTLLDQHLQTESGISSVVASLEKAYSVLDNNDQTPEVHKKYLMQYTIDLYLQGKVRVIDFKSEFLKNKVEDSLKTPEGVAPVIQGLGRAIGAMKKDPSEENDAKGNLQKYMNDMKVNDNTLLQNKDFLAMEVALYCKMHAETQVKRLFAQRKLNVYLGSQEIKTLDDKKFNAIKKGVTEIVAPSLNRNETNQLNQNLTQINQDANTQLNDYNDEIDMLFAYDIQQVDNKKKTTTEEIKEYKQRNLEDVINNMKVKMMDVEKLIKAPDKSLDQAKKTRANLMSQAEKFVGRVGAGIKQLGKGRQR